MKGRLLFCALALAICASCSGTDASQVATGPVVTTPPLALPITLVPLQPGQAATSPPVPTAEPGPLVGLTPAPFPTVPATPTVPSTAEPAVAQESAQSGTTSVPQPAAPAETVATGAAEPTVASADGPETTPSGTPTPEGPTPTPTPNGWVGFVDVPVVDVFTGATVQLGPLSPTGATLLYFWSPNCPQCLIDAPAIAQFARDTPSISVVGLGAGTFPDSIETATQFVSRTGLVDDGTMTMVYDASYRSWRHLGAPSSTPHWMLYDRSGQLVIFSPGAIDFDLIASHIGG